MAEINGCGSAFPVVVQDLSKYQVAEFGMSLRDYFIAHSPVTFEMVLRVWGSDSMNLAMDDTRKPFFAVWALLSCEYADAMIAEREKP